MRRPELQSNRHDCRLNWFDLSFLLFRQGGAKNAGHENLVATSGAAFWWAFADGQLLSTFKLLQSTQLGVVGTLPASHLGNLISANLELPGNLPD